jgi:cob(I)alamin adenosyltransferase
MSIYTKAGDKGKSILKSKRRMYKSSLVFEVLGSLDEFNCTLGLLHQTKITEIKTVVLAIQRDLMLIGSILSGFTKDTYSADFWPERSSVTEELITFFNSLLKPLTSFIYPGGCIEAANLHIARTVCRRFERVLVKYWRYSKISNVEEIEKYVNRLSDLLFVLARFANKVKGVKEITREGTK